jgi:hypothetical protein
MAEVVDRCATMYDEQQEKHRKAQLLRSFLDSNLVL